MGWYAAEGRKAQAVKPKKIRNLGESSPKRNSDNDDSSGIRSRAERRLRSQS